jgi:nitroreductase
VLPERWPGVWQGPGMETWDALRARRNVRAFTDEPITGDELDRVLEAAWRAPSASNRQLWAFIAITDPATLDGMAETWRGASWVGGAPAGIALLHPVDPDDDGGSDRRREVMQYDLGQATLSIMVAAADLGLASGQASVMDQDRAREVLGFPEGWRCSWVVALGHPADRPLRPIAKPFDEVVHRDRW